MNKQGKHTTCRTRTGTTIIALAAVFLCQALWAEHPAAGYEMTFAANQAHGDLISEGRYRLAVYRLSHSSDDPLATRTNLCVAQTMIGQFHQARRNCNRAVELNEQAARSAPGSGSDVHFKNWVVALSNRGVLRAIRDQDGANEDFRHAIELQVYSDTAARNLVRLNQKEPKVLAAH